jgi:hypothetical protein
MITDNVFASAETTHCHLTGTLIAWVFSPFSEIEALLAGLTVESVMDMAIVVAASEQCVV